MTGQLLQFGGSLLAILALFWLAHRLRLGGDRRIRTEEQARELADEALCGFEAEEIALDRSGHGALLRDAQERVLLLRRHGAHFAARLIDRRASVRLDRNALTIATPDTSFGTVTLDLGPAAQHWAASFRRLPA